MYRLSLSAKIVEIDTPVFHIPVLVESVITGLGVRRDCWYIDATAGGGGHTEAIVRTGGNVLAIDQDEAAIQRLTKRFAKEITQGKIKVKQGNFKELAKLVEESGIPEIDGVLFDLGMSTYQIKESGRGFSFLRDEPLDMRMSNEATVTAAEIVNTYRQEELDAIFRRFGEEILAQKLAYAIVRTRVKKPIRTAQDLAQIAETVYKEARRREKIHPATRMFQALRIAVNDELMSLREGLRQAFSLLSPEGRLVVISFHSLEDRIVKLFFQKESKAGTATLVTKSSIRPEAGEIRKNPASRSAHLRILTKK